MKLSELASIHGILSHGLRTPQAVRYNLLLNFTVKKISLNIYLVKFPTKNCGKRDNDPDGSNLAMGARILS
jgi:hypothetical protein